MNTKIILIVVLLTATAGTFWLLACEMSHSALAETERPARAEQWAPRMRAGRSTGADSAAVVPQPEGKNIRLDGQIQLCQALAPAAATSPWQAFSQGEYVGHSRTSHVPEYRLRVDDQVEFRYRATREQVNDPTQLSVGDKLKIESFTDTKLDREVIIQQDGTITVPLLGRVPATRRTPPQLRDELEKRYKQYVKMPAITVTPLKTNTKLKDLLEVVDARYGAGGQSLTVRVAPDGTIALPAIGSSVPAQGLTLDELENEIEQRYLSVAKIVGVEVTPSLFARAPRYIYVLGEVKTPGRFELTGPTTVMQALALAGSWNVGANLKQVVVFRRGDDWQLLATKLDIRGAVYGRSSCPAGEIWLNDSDVVVVPKSLILEVDEWIDLVFTRGIYGVIPFQGVTISLSKLSTL